MAFVPYGLDDIINLSSVYCKLVLTEQVIQMTNDSDFYEIFRKIKTINTVYLLITHKHVNGSTI